MPDEYGVTITFTNGESEKMEIVWHSDVVTPENRFRFTTCNDTVGWIAMNLIAKIELDHRFIKINELAIKEKERLKTEEDKKLQLVKKQ
jgi:hypothetical protein